MKDDELIAEVREMGEHPCRAHLPMDKTLRQANARIEALTAEVERLREAVEPLANLYGGDVNMNDPLRKWFTMANLERARAALQPQEKVR